MLKFYMDFTKIMERINMTEQEIWTIVQNVAASSNCKKRNVGCIIMDENDTIVSTGYNWHEDGVCDCIPGPGSALHAEDMAVHSIPDVFKRESNLKAYINHKPCDKCISLLEEHCTAINVKPLSKRLTDDTERSGSIEDTLGKRAGTHGDFEMSSRFVQMAKTMMASTPNWSDLSSDKAEALHMIQHKIGRILYGDPAHIDNWHDIAGYATLVEKELE